MKKIAKTAPTKGASGTHAGASSKPAAPTNKAVDEDHEQITQTLAHIPDRDQEFRLDPAAVVGERWIGGADEDQMANAQDADEGDSSAVSDPSFEREGASRILRVTEGDRSLEEHMTPAAFAGSGEDDERGIVQKAQDATDRSVGEQGVLPFHEFLDLGI